MAGITKMAEVFLEKDELLDVIREQGIAHKKRSDHKLEFKDLMRYRIDKILLVCSFYDYYTIVEDGHLQEALFNEYLELNLHYAPHIKRAYSGQTALKYLEKEEFDLIITTLRLGDINIREFSEKVKEKYPDVPHVLLASQSRELQMLIERSALKDIDKIFIWNGDRKIFLAIIKHYEDRMNADIDCLQFGVTCIILVEDSPVFYSSYLPKIYTEVMNQTQKLIQEGNSTAEKVLRQRARPKIFHAQNYEEAISFFKKYQNSLLGIVTDIKFRKNGKMEEEAGLDLVVEVKKELPHLPMLVQSSQNDKKQKASQLGVAFLDKNSRTLLLELREFMKLNFGFGDFVFRLPDGTEVLRAGNLRDFRDKLKFIPKESLLYHASQNHFSYWMIARTEFELAYKIRPVTISQFSNTDELRFYLINAVTNHLKSEHRGSIAIFSRSDFQEERVFQMIGEGSLGGKARGLAFIDKILKDYLDPDYFPGVTISVPRSIVLGTDIFNHFMEINDLYPKVSRNIPDDQILRSFLHADLPPTVLGDLRAILNKTKYPLAIRSSSLLEDAVYQPFAGVYATVMIPNSSSSFDNRFHNLVQAIKFVYSSTYSKNAKNYIEATGNMIEEEKMGLIIQEVAGRKFDQYYYPHFSGVARSYNYYPFGKATPKDGVVNLALGLGKTIVEGGKSLQYSPVYPAVYPQFGSTKDLFSKSQTEFLAIDLKSDTFIRVPSEDRHLKTLMLRDSEKHGTLQYLASTYSSQNDMVFEGISREGPRILNFAPILKSRVIPLNDIVLLLLKLSEVAMNSPVEIEFAVVLGKEEAMPAQFRFLQVRPMVKQETEIKIDYDKINRENIILKASSALGNGHFKLDHVLFVKPDTFAKNKTRQIANEISDINMKLLKDNKFYILMGPGRWGSTDPWLGIPVNFSDISAAQIIVETALPDMLVDPSQGSHFFQNITSFKIAYFTVKLAQSEKIDYDWLNKQKVEYESEFVKLVKTEDCIHALVNGQSGDGVMLKPNGTEILNKNQ